MAIAPKLPPVFSKRRLQTVGMFALATFTGWATVWLIIFPCAFLFTDQLVIHCNETCTRNEQIILYLRNNFLVLFSCFILGSFGVTVRMHIEGLWKETASQEISTYGLLTVGSFFGMFSYLALDAGFLTFLVQTDSESVEPSVAAIMLFAVIFGMFAIEIYKRGLKKINETNDKLSTPVAKENHNAD